MRLIKLLFMTGLLIITITACGKVKEETETPLESTPEEIQINQTDENIYFKGRSLFSVIHWLSILISGAGMGMRAGSDEFI